VSTCARGGPESVYLGQRVTETHAPSGPFLTLNPIPYNLLKRNGSKSGPVPYRDSFSQRAEGRRERERVRARAQERARKRQTERESERGRACPSTPSLICRTARGRKGEKEREREGERERARARGSEAERQIARGRERERGRASGGSNSQHPAGSWRILGWRAEWMEG